MTEPTAGRGGGTSTLTAAVESAGTTPARRRAAQRETKRQARREARRASQRSRRSVRLRRLGLTAVVGGVVVGAGAAYVVYASPFFDIRDVTVVGAPSYLADPIEQAAGVTLGGPLVSVDLAVIEDRVSQLIDVQSVDAQQQWPHTVVVTVVPRTAVGVVPTGGGVELVGSDGAAMGVIEAPLTGLPEVKAGGDDRRRVAQALSTLDPAALAAVQWGQVRDGQVELQLRDDRGFVLWGDNVEGAAKGKALGVLLTFDEDARWFDLTRAGTPTTLLTPPPDARLPANAASPSPTPGASTAATSGASAAPTPEAVPAASAGSVPVQPPSGTGGEQPAGLVPQSN